MASVRPLSGPWLGLPGSPTDLKKQPLSENASPSPTVPAPERLNMKTALSPMPPAPPQKDVETTIDQELENLDHAQVLSTTQAAYDLIYLRSGGPYDIPELNTEGLEVKHRPEPKDLNTLLSRVEQVQQSFTNLVNKLREATSSHGCVQCWVAPTKVKEQILRKAVHKYGGRLSCVKDVLRASAIFEDLGSLLRGLGTLKGLAREMEACSILRVKSSFSGCSLYGGYRDVKVNLSFSGIVCELQLHLQPLWNLQKESGYEAYQLARKLRVSHLFDPLEAVENLQPSVISGMLARAMNVKDNWKCGRLHEAQGEYQMAYQDYVAAEKGKLATSGQDHPSCVEHRVILGQLQRALGMKQQALETLSGAMPGSQKLLGLSHPLAIIVAASVLKLQKELGKRSDYEHTMQKLLRSRSPSSSSTLPSESDSRWLLDGYRDRGRYADISEGVRALLDIKQIGREHWKVEELVKVLYETSCEVNGTHHTRSLELLHAMAILLYSKGRANDSANYLQVVVAGKREALGPAHPSTVYSLRSLCLALEERKEYGEAESLYKRALEEQDQSSQPDVCIKACILHWVGSVARRQERYNETEQYYRQSLELLITVDGEGSLSVQSLRNSLAGVLQSQGKTEEAVELYRVILARRMSILGEKHPSVLSTMNNLAQALRVKGGSQSIQEAETLLLRTLSLADVTLGPQHADRFIYVRNLAALYEKMNRLQEAAHWTERAIEGRSVGTQNGSGPRTGCDAKTVHHLGRLYQKLGKLTEAEKYLRLAVEERSRSLGESHPDTVTTQLNLAQVLEGQDKSDEAITLYQLVLSEREGTLGPEHPKTLNSLEALALAFFRAKNYSQADKHLERLVTLRSALQGEDAPDTLSALTHLAILRREQGREGESKELLLRVSKLNSGHFAVKGKIFDFQEVSTELRAAMLVKRMDQLEVESFSPNTSPHRGA